MDYMFKLVRYVNSEKKAADMHQKVQNLAETEDVVNI